MRSKELLLISATLSVLDSKRRGSRVRMTCAGFISSDQLESGRRKQVKKHVLKCCKVGASLSLVSSLLDSCFFTFFFFYCFGRQGVFQDRVFLCNSTCL